MKMIDETDVKNNGVTMAWNEPGSDGDKEKGEKEKPKNDPWGSNSGNKKSSNDQTPPDLDQIVKDIQGKVTKLFGGKSGGGGGGNKSGSTGEGPSNTLVGILFGVLLVFWLASGIYIVDPAERGVVLKFGSYSSTSLPGPHWRLPYPIESVEIVDVDQIRNVEVGYRSNAAGRSQSGNVPQESLMLTQDENIVDIKFAVQYRVKEAQEYLFNVRDPDATLRQATESAIREAIGKSKMDFVLTQGQSDIATRTEELIQQILDRYKTGLIVTSVNLQSAQPPNEVKGAFEDAIRAREDKQRFINEADAYSNDIIPKARGNAARQLEEAAGYKARVVAQAEGESKRFVSLLTEYEKAPEVTRERLYIDMMQSVMSKTSKVMVDVEGGNNLLYLPLDKLMSSSNAQMDLSRLQLAPQPQISVNSLAPQSKERRLRDSLRNRGVR